GEDGGGLFSGPAMNTPGPRGAQIELLLVAQPRSRLLYRGGDVRHLIARVFAIEHGGFVGCLGAQARPRADAIDLTLDEARRIAATVHSANLEPEPRRARGGDQNRVHGITLPTVS